MTTAQNKDVTDGADTFTIVSNKEVHQSIAEPPENNPTISIEHHEQIVALHKQLHREQMNERENEVKLALEKERKVLRSETGKTRKKLTKCTSESITVVKSLRKQLWIANQQIQTYQIELDETKNRLSSLMSQMLTDNNPNVADLSDKNRPTKLAERYTELYDNQWTDAYDVLVDGFEMETIKTLKELLQVSMRFCVKHSTEQMQRLRSDLMFVNEKNSTIPLQVNKSLKDCRKMTADKAGQNLYERFLQELKSPSSKFSKIVSKIEDYVHECFIICWLMAIQDPPVVIDEDNHAGARFNTNLYRAYTINGPLVCYTVWPAIFLHEGGSVLCKGVAQGMTK